MTVIAAAATPAGVILAADAQISNGWEKAQHITPKVWVTDQYAIGASGQLRNAQIVRHLVDWPIFRPSEDTDLERFMVKQAVPAIRAAVKANGALRNDNGIETVEVTLLLAVADQLVTIDSGGAVLSDPRGRMAIGAGYAEALGHLGDAGPWEEADVVEAVRRATISARGCSGPITVVNARTLAIRRTESP